MKVLYISGPFSHPDTVRGIPKNILQAAEGAAWVAASRGIGAEERQIGGSRP